MKFIPIIFLIISISCQSPNPEFKSIDSSTSYKLLEIGSKKSPQIGEIIFLEVIATALNGDTIHYVPNYSYHHTIQHHYLDSIWQLFNIEDRFLLKIPTSKVRDYFTFFTIEQSLSDTLILDIYMKESHLKQAAQKVVEEQLSVREVEEQRLLKEYLKNSTEQFILKDGVYLVRKDTTEGAEIKNGSEVSIHYKGRFLDGYVFDDTYKKGITPSFTYGQDYQMLSGIKTALRGLKEGESVKIILPSRHAFKDGGSLAGIVPPYTAVIYDVNIIKVIN